ncbi:uncharacterized protein PHACADRAFT_210131 [Phanerochaete carnosa HHB-10118-sp]|uniref:Uncharacterized protein n=1 Tax=Phanerochaete carnosa (strain HHB-10118-sp) TaxID=650164 RepID=K5UWC4_PHACS|nr:uncharacterized protein PHACADRAFT_210131 [Phanerochaete carnosa HHB-10118-sp]EKM54321.1 hypothetical protein PHACADRAFT_210131 [Phanerochaete carnosa HHB-10118-sp]
MSQPSSSIVQFPAPIGGVPFSRDFAPSILFACLYGLLAFLGIYRLARSTSRNVMVFSFLAFIIERVVIWSLRAKQARTPSEDFSRSLTIYWQITFSIGFLAIHGIILNLLRCLVVHTTKGTSPTPESSPTIQTEEMGGLRAFMNKSKTSVAIPPLEYGPQEDQPRRRALYRRMFGLLALLSIAPAVIGSLMGNGYVDAVADPKAAASAVQALRPVATLTLTLTQLCIALSVWAILMIPRVKRNAVILLLALEFILAVIPIYHLVITGDWTTSLISTASGSQNTSGEKAAFYVFQALPELAPCVALLIVNMKTTFETGNFGDGIRDPKKKPTSTPAAQGAA